MKRQKRTNLSPRNHRLITIFVIALIAGGIGLYLLQSSFATVSYTNMNWLRFNDGTRALDIMAARKGATMDIPVYVQNIDRSGPGPTYAAILITYDRHFLEFKGFTCASTYPCKKLTRLNGPLPNPRQHIGALACITVPPNTHVLAGRDEMKHLLTIQTKVVTNDYISEASVQGMDQVIVWQGSVPGTCASNPDATGVKWVTNSDGRMDGANNCAGVRNSVPPCDSGSDIALGKAESKRPSGSGSGGTGTGTNGNGTGTGGTGKGSGKSGAGSGRNGSGLGGGGSNATKQSESPKPTPEPTPQGAKEEDPKEQEPSPFFDGKEYPIGSDPDAQTPADLVTNPGKALNNVWFYPVAAVVLVGLGFGAWFGWKRWKQYTKSRRNT